MGKENTKKTLADETNQLVHRIIDEGVDGIIGGFPCQDISGANRYEGGGSGLAGNRSGLFWKMFRAVRLVRPRIWLMENVAALFQRERQADMGAILGAVASIGYDCEWDCVGAGTVGAPHHRARAYILAHRGGVGRKRHFPSQVSRQPEFSKFEGIRSIEDLRKRSDLFGSLICRSTIGLAKRLHAIGNGNPPCVIRELTKGLT